MSKTLYDLLQAHFGIKTSFRVNPITALVGDTATKIFSHNPNRVGLVIVNTGTANFYLSPLNTVTAGVGILVSAGGGGVTFTWDEDFELVSSEIFGICEATESSAIYALEVFTL